ncbi:MAG: carboxypeptidase-like regulatory domain-containing protein [Saprospiraceae bacterium]
MILLIKPQKHFFKITMLLWFLFFSQIGLGQNLMQTIRGNVYDSYTHNPLDGASVAIIETEFGTTTDVNGNYRLEKVPVGRYSLQVSFVGYETLTISEILLESGKEMVLEISLKESSSSLKEVVVKGTAPNSRNKILPSAEILTIEETLRLPATFYDPARLAFSYAGVATNNDQANHMIIRGNSPNHMSWRLEGVEIVNPNHTSNAGTASDRPSQNGGGVNMLSAQLLGNSTFMRGAFPANYGNALSGIMDMSFRKGNSEQHEFTGQIGVIGIDFAAEGPFSKNKKASYLINYRYSTLGLLGAAGVDLGDEAINYQDLAFTTFFPLKRGGEIKLFGLFGSSSNIFEAKEDSLRMEEKDFKNIDYNSNVNLLGATYRKSFSGRWRWENTIIYSTRDDDYRAVNVTTEPDSLIISDNISDNKTTVKSILNYKINNHSNLTGGINYLMWDDDKTLGSNFIRPFIGWNTRYNSFEIDFGTGYSYFNFNKTGSLTSQFSVKYNLSTAQSISFSYSDQSQLQNRQIYYSQPPNNIEDFGNENLEMLKSNQLVLAYRNQLSEKIIFKTELYYQILSDVPVSRDADNSFSILNYFNEINEQSLVSEGEGKNYGIEITAQKYFSKNTFWLANVSLYESKYEGSDGIERDTRFNGNYIVNATYGKEFPYSKKGKDYILGVNLRVNFMGGLRETPIDEIASEAAGTTIYNEAEAYTLKQKDIFKTDLRVYWKRNKKKFNSTLALDIQNVTNTKNESFKYYDTFLDEVVQKYQLGLIPILSYRIEF